LNTNGYENDPPLCVFGKLARFTAADTHAPSAGSGDCETETSATPPLPDTLTCTLTTPLADDLSPHELTRPFTPAIAFEIMLLSSASGRLLLPPPAGGALPPPPWPPFLNFVQHAPS
jgi:hypothetical protein